MGNQQGATLLELLIASALGLISISALAALVGFTIGVNAVTLAKMRLHEELDTLMLAMTEEIRRAGFGRHIGLVQGNLPQSPFSASLDISSHGQETQNSCILFAYDRNMNGLLDIENGNEKAGFRLHDKAVEMRVDGRSCLQGGWQDITDPSIININQLSFELSEQDAALSSVSTIKIILQGELVKDPSIQHQITRHLMLPNYD